MNTEVNIAGISFKNPVVTASGTFGSGMEYGEFIDLGALGGVVTKGVSAEAWEGNPTPRVCETPSGMLNAIGLQNPGAELFIKRDIPFLLNYDTRIIVNVCGHTEEEYIKAVEMLNDTPADMFEINISCPNVKQGGIAFGTEPSSVLHITSVLKRYSKKPLIMKLSPNVTDITETARAAETGGADAVSLINTLMGMKIDINARKPFLGNRTGGLSGPAIRPVAVNMVYRVYEAVKIPIIGMGGITNGNDALEFIMAGATCVAVGTANFREPYSTIRTVVGIEKYMRENEIEDISELIGCAHRG